MTISGSETLFLTLAFIVPGFIARSVVAGFVPLRRDNDQSLFLQYLTSSCIQYGFWSGLILWIIASDCVNQNPLLASFLFFLMAFVSPVLFGLLISHLHQTNKLRDLFTKPYLKFLKLDLLHSIPNSWDFRFSQIQTASWLRVTLRVCAQMEQ